jgi:Uma2 family endonuclease
MKSDLCHGELPNMSTPIVSNQPESSASGTTLPPLQPGDHLDQKTFHQLYETAHEGFRAELIGGVVFIPFTVSADHADDHGLIVTWLNMYRISTPGTRALADATIILGPSSEPQPDGVLLILPEYGGQSYLDGRYLAGAPELVVEVAYSSQAYDPHLKYLDYERAGVREYLVVVLHQKVVEWFVRQDDHFQPLAAGADGWFRSRIFPGLWLDPAALFSGDAAGVLQALQRGLAAPGHAAFAAQLAAKRRE